MAKDLISPPDLAKWFINRTERDAGDVITHLKLQKLVYYAQAWHLANYGRPLFNEDMEAWTHGPVVPSLWTAYRDMGWDPIPPEPDFEIANPKLVPLLESVYESYGAFSAKRLEDITHAEDPWKVTRGNLRLEARCTRPISKALMRDFYGRRISKSWDDAAGNKKRPGN